MVTIITLGEALEAEIDRVRRELPLLQSHFIEDRMRADLDAAGHGDVPEQQRLCKALRAYALPGARLPTQKFL